MTVGIQTPGAVTMVDSSGQQAHEPKVLRVRVVVPTAAVAAFSTLTLAGVAALGFASGDLSSQPSTPDAKGWVITAPRDVQGVDTVPGEAAVQPGGVDGPPASGGTPGAGAAGSSPSQSALPGGSGGASSPPAGRPATPAPATTGPRPGAQQAGASVPKDTGELSIHLSVSLLAHTRESVAQGLRAGLSGQLGAARADQLQTELRTSASMDAAVAEATGTAAESSLRAAQAVSGPTVAPADVSSAAVIEFMRVLPDELTRTVHPVVVAALARTGDQVSANTLNVVLGGATDEAAQQLSDLAVPQVKTQVVALVETTAGDGVMAPTATVTTEPPSAPPSTPTDTSTDPSRGTEPPATTEPTDPGRATTPPPTDSDRSTEPPAPQPTPPATDSDRSTEPPATDSSPSTSDTPPASDAPSESGDDTAGSRGTSSPEGSAGTPTSDPTSPTSTDPAPDGVGSVVVVPSGSDATTAPETVPESAPEDSLASAPASSSD